MNVKQIPNPHVHLILCGKSFISASALILGNANPAPSSSPSSSVTWFHPAVPQGVAHRRIQAGPTLNITCPHRTSNALQPSDGP
ncbi:hypothetical protein SKAU_G00294050 [Synaphobranchus kaupii]|uniref:Uncharacterized protein n=1 Tax=Synaphobranchus kaupii TaxID=118154 RepID=A0A9Q1EUB9_SYNKA|nr:hypothetical protein SKAU_G00294050 [Synaphobranchus kaupii]